MVCVRVGHGGNIYNLNICKCKNSHKHCEVMPSKLIIALSSDILVVDINAEYITNVKLSSRELL